MKTRAGGSMRAIAAWALLVLLTGLGAHAADVEGKAKPADAQTPPNVVIIFCDDLGYTDVGCFGAEGFETPALDRLAREGRRFTSFYSAQPICTSSRVGLLTGCYPNRLGLVGGARPERAAGNQRSGIDDCQPAPVALLCHGDFWQMAFGAPSAIPADAARLRRIFRDPVFQRHGADGSGQGLPRRAAGRGRQDDRACPRPIATDAPVHRARGRFYRAEARPTFLLVRGTHHAPRAHLCLGEIQRQVGVWTVRRRHHGDRLVGQPDYRRRSSGMA